MHFVADFSSGKYGWTTKKDQIVSGMDWLLKKLNTDYIDFGFIHCIDEPSDLKKYLEGGALEHIQELKKTGRCSSHWSFLPHAGHCQSDAGYGPSGCGDVQHQSGL